MKTRNRNAGSLLVLAFSGLMVVGCEVGSKSGRGLALPEGDVAAGQAVFIARECTSCHLVKGVELPAPRAAGEARFELGGMVSRVHSHGELVTAIVNPSHKLAARYRPPDGTQSEESPMRRYNDVLTVQELIDLVAFLQPRYKIAVPRGHTYPLYAP